MSDKNEAPTKDKLAGSAFVRFHAAVMRPLPNLCYTIALDKPGEDVHRRMARLLVSSLIRTGWHGKIVVFHDNPVPVLMEGHPEVEEKIIQRDAHESWIDTMSWKYQVAGRLNLDGIGKVLFLDCDIIALRGINHLMLGSWELFVAPEYSGHPSCRSLDLTDFPFNGYLSESEMTGLRGCPGLNAGVFGIKATAYQEVTRQWAEIDARIPLRPWIGRDQHSWNRLVLDTPMRHRNFADGEIYYPFLHPVSYPDYRRAALVHAASRSPGEKLSFLQALWTDVHGAVDL